MSPTLETHAEIRQESETTPIRVRVADQIAGMARAFRHTEADLISAGVMRVGEAQQAEVLGAGHPDLNVNQQARAEALAQNNR